MNIVRASGILLHPTSLPGPYGIGDLGPEAYRWIDFLAAAGCRYWQILPLSPTGHGDSPYQSFSAFAGNPYLVSPALLIQAGYLEPEDMDEMPVFDPHWVDYGSFIPWKIDFLDLAYDRFSAAADPVEFAAFDDFQREQGSWLSDFAFFMALKEHFDGQPWPMWPADLRDREVQAMDKARREFAVKARRQAFRQYLFFQQWQLVRDHARRRGVQIIGDIPLFIAHDSADAWVNPDLFYMDDEGRPTVVAGVPPDYFSPTGQLWGNPLYRWDVHKDRGYAWWISRLRAVLGMVDLIRLDHFRGFAGYWEIPGEAETAEVGRWVPGPGEDFFHVIKDALGELPLLAEDLGEITPDVVALRDQFNLPGMKIVQFAFSGPENQFLPHHYQDNYVVYTGTHDNDTSRGWFEAASEGEKDFCRRYLGTAGDGIAWDLIRAAWSSVASIAVAPMQDLLELDSRARFNFPSRLGGNWAWRMDTGALSEGLSLRLRELNILYSRLAETVSGLENSLT